MRNYILNKRKELENPLNLAVFLSKFFQIFGLISAILVSLFFTISLTLNDTSASPFQVYSNTEFLLSMLLVISIYISGICFAYLADTIYKDRKLDESFSESKGE